MVGKRFETVRSVQPEPYLIIGNYRPYAPVSGSHCCIGRRWFRLSYRVRMIISRNFRPSATGFTVRINQSLRINFEMRFGFRVNILGRHGVRDMTIPAQQYPATFLRVLGLGMGTDVRNDTACYFNNHRAWP